MDPYSGDSKLLHIHSKQLFLLQFLIIQKHNFKKSNISKDQVAFFPCASQEHIVLFVFQCSVRGRQQIWELVKLLTNLNLAYVSYTQQDKKYFRDLKGLKWGLAARTAAV